MHSIASDPTKMVSTTEPTQAATMITTNGSISASDPGVLLPIKYHNNYAAYIMIHVYIVVVVAFTDNKSIRYGRVLK